MGPIRPGGVLISVAAERFDTMVAFYRDVLRLPVRGEKAGFVNFEFDDQRLTLATHSHVEGPTKDPNRVMVNFMTGTIDDDVEHLRSHGVEILRHVERERWGGKVATFLDPDGNQIQLLQPPSD